MYVIVRDNDVSKAAKLLKRKLHNEGVLKEVRDRRAFVSKGEQKRAADKAGKYRWIRKRQKLEQQFVREERNQLRNNKNKRRQQQNKKPYQKRRT
jgi:small subunit ribosomal protein S21